MCERKSLAIIGKWTLEGLFYSLVKMLSFLQQALTKEDCIIREVLKQLEAVKLNDCLNMLLAGVFLTLRN